MSKINLERKQTNSGEQHVRHRQLARQSPAVIWIRRIEAEVTGYAFA